ncbi:hypothetical protein Lfu02_71740 [Longispora fulva]|uniref:Uncharacterized protein n=1 Tax=Longispora fulva TaxID=619741 RepID=A0A8J7GPT7_9ACTN|nr:hypothetical protein [Longispora fulva]GIG62802.1 hypothetical protein Lfu02_71740 [Longispora fulva]
MLVGSLLLILVAVALVIAGLAYASNLLLIAAVVICGVAAVLIYRGSRQPVAAAPTSSRATVIAQSRISDTSPSESSGGEDPSGRYADRVRLAGRITTAETVAPDWFRDRHATPAADTPGASGSSGGRGEPLSDLGGSGSDAGEPSSDPERSTFSSSQAFSDPGPAGSGQDFSGSAPTAHGSGRVFSDSPAAFDSGRDGSDPSTPTLEPGQAGSDPEPEAGRSASGASGAVSSPGLTTSGPGQAPSGLGLTSSGLGSALSDLGQASSGLGGALSELGLAADSQLPEAGRRHLTGSSYLGLTDPPERAAEPAAPPPGHLGGSAFAGPANRTTPDLDDEELEYEDDPEDEPAAQEVAPAVTSRIGRLTTRVWVVDGRPRYHLSGCHHLVGRDPEPLPVGEAQALGFSPCGLCEPATALGGRS